MLFNSLVFVVFAFLFFLFWPFLKYTRRPAWIYLIVFSFFFYGWWDWRFLFLIILSGLIDFVAALLIVDRPRYRRLWLIVSMSGNLGTLAVFKYSRFVWENLHALVPLLPAAPPVNDFFLILPVGISFYTFQSMSYTIDVYRGEVTPTRSVLKFFAYLSLFPQLVAGPIVRARDFLHQLDAPRCTDEATRYRGLELILHGYFKKVVIADNLAPVVNAAFGAATPEASAGHWWLVMVAFAFQIYCDFSGYSDIARGLAKWMGYDFQRNFDHPYTSLSIREFWTRWHISLSSWFRDYVYIPLGGSRCGRVREAANLWVTMLVSGLWHGAAWHFVIWGALHAAFLSAEKLIGYPALLARSAPGRLLAFLIVAVQVLVAWVFFRASSLDQAIGIVRIMFSFSGPSPSSFGAGAIVLMAGMAMREWYLYLGGHPLFARPIVRTAMLALTFWAVLFLRGHGEQFIYFQF